MTFIKEGVCSECWKKRVKALEELLKDNLFWRTCKFCHRYGLPVSLSRSAFPRDDLSPGQSP